MRYTLANIEERVCALLDENPEILNERVEYSDPGASLATLVEMFAEESAVETLLEADSAKIDECRHYPQLVGLNRTPAIGEMQEIMCSVHRNEQTGKTRVRLPDDFLRLLYFRMSDWEDGVTAALKFGGDECRLRNAARLGRRMHRHRPAVALDRRGDRTFLEIFCTSDGASVAEMDYLTIPRLKQKEIDIPPALFGDFCQRIASKIAEILRERQ